MPKVRDVLVHAATNFSLWGEIHVSSRYLIATWYAWQCVWKLDQISINDLLSLHARSEKWNKYQRDGPLVLSKLQITIRTSYRCPVFHELCMIAAKNAHAIIDDVLLNMPHTQQNRGLRKRILQRLYQGKISINSEDLWKSIVVEELVQEHNSSTVRLFILVLHKDEGREERGVQCDGPNTYRRCRRYLLVLYVESKTNTS